jgi:sugar lactone lactonase YvrE
VAAATVLSTSRDRVGESPVWSVAEQALYWVDIEGRSIRRFDWASQKQQAWTLPERVGCIALSTRNTVIAAMESGVFEVTLAQTPVLNLLASVQHATSNMRFNDGRCDASGRLWVGSMQMDMSLAATDGALYCLDENGLSAPKLPGLITPNGSAFSPDGQRMYLSDSHPSRQTIWTFDFDVASATLSKQQPWVDMKPLPGRPDGAAVDADGCYWICGNDAGLVHCFSPAGTLLRSLAVPVSKPAMCAFGGPQLEHLFVTSIIPGKPADGFDASLDGAVFVLQPGVRGLAEPLFSRFPLSVQ